MKKPTFMIISWLIDDIGDMECIIVFSIALKRMWLKLLPQEIKVLGMENTNDQTQSLI